MKGTRVRCFAVIVLVILAIQHQTNGQQIFQLIRQLLQENVAGAPLVHKQTVWDFDPDVSEKRRNLFYEKNGFRAAKYIERIGVGTDGKEEERRAMQAERDRGRLNGEHFINFP